MYLPDGSEIKHKNTYIIYGMKWRCTKHIEKYGPTDKRYNKIAILKHRINRDIALAVILDCGHHQPDVNVTYISAEITNKNNILTHVRSYETLEDCLLAIYENLLTRVNNDNIKNNNPEYYTNCKLAYDKLNKLGDLYNIRDVLE
jgi:hypothetical protein